MDHHDNFVEVGAIEACVGAEVEEDVVEEEVEEDVDGEKEDGDEEDKEEEVEDVVVVAAKVVEEETRFMSNSEHPLKRP